MITYSDTHDHKQAHTQRHEGFYFIFFKHLLGWGPGNCFLGVNMRHDEIRFYESSCDALVPIWQSSLTTPTFTHRLWVRQSSSSGSGLWKIEETFILFHACFFCMCLRRPLCMCLIRCDRQICREITQQTCVCRCREDIWKQIHRELICLWDRKRKVESDKERLTKKEKQIEMKGGCKENS